MSSRVRPILMTLPKDSGPLVSRMVPMKPPFVLLRSRRLLPAPAEAQDDVPIRLSQPYIRRFPLPSTTGLEGEGEGESKIWTLDDGGGDLH